MVLDSPDTPSAPNKKSGVSWLDLTVSICALITSGVSIYMARENSSAMEDLVHANSWPFVQLSSGNSASGDVNDHTLTFALNNAGTGPARIYRFQFLVDDEPVDGANLFSNVANACCQQELRATLADVADPIEAVGMVQTSRITTTMLAANAEAVALRWSRTANNAELWDAMDRARQTGRIAVTACYCSVFDECWDARSNSLPTRRTAICEEPPPNPTVTN